MSLSTFSTLVIFDIYNIVNTLLSVELHEVGLNTFVNILNIGDFEHVQHCQHSQHIVNTLLSVELHKVGINIFVSDFNGNIGGFESISMSAISTLAFLKIFDDVDIVNIVDIGTIVNIVNNCQHVSFQAATMRTRDALGRDRASRLG